MTAAFFMVSAHWWKLYTKLYIVWLSASCNSYKKYKY